MFRKHNYLVCAKPSFWKNIPLETFSQWTCLMVLWSRGCRPPPTEESPQSTWTLGTPTVTLWLFSLETAGRNIYIWIFMIWREIVNWKVEHGLLAELTLYQHSFFRDRFICQVGRSYSRQMFFNSRGDYSKYYWRSVMRLNLFPVK